MFAVTWLGAPRPRFSILAASVGLVSFVCCYLVPAGAVEQIRPPVALQFSYDRPVDAVAAPFVLAVTRGLFRAEGLNVSTNIAAGTRDAIARVASGASEMAIADVNELIRYRGGPEAASVKAVFIVQNAAPYAVVARKSRGVTTLASLEGKTLGVADGDLAIRLWPDLARRNGLRPLAVKQERISAAVREPMLSAGQVDAVTGFSYLSAVNLRDRGIPADDLAVFRFADYGSPAYGLAVIVNPKFAADKPDAVRAFLRAVIAGMHLAVRQPVAAIDDVMTQMDGGSRELELVRLSIALRHNVLTEDVKRDGVGAMDAVRFEASLDAIAEDFTFRKRPALGDIFDDAYLPALAERKFN